MVPNRTLAAPDDFSHVAKRYKERVSVLLITNSTGTYKSKLMVIGNFKAPCCLKGINLKNLHANCLSNKNAWMCSELFKELLLDFDSNIRRQH